MEKSKEEGIRRWKWLLSTPCVTWRLSSWFNLAAQEVCSTDSQQARRQALFSSLQLDADAIAATNMMVYLVEPLLCQQQVVLGKSKCVLVFIKLRFHPRNTSTHSYLDRRSGGMPCVQKNDAGTAYGVRVGPRVSECFDF